MPGRLLHVGAVVQCPHQGRATIAAAQTKVFVGGQAVATADSQIKVAGCPFQVPAGAGTKPQPCVSVTWGTRATKVRIGAQAVLLGPLPGTVPGSCASAEQIPQGPPVLSQLQQRANGT